MEFLIPELINIFQLLLYVIAIAGSTALTLWIKEKVGIERMRKISEQMHNEDSLAFRALMLVKEGIQESGLVEENLNKAAEWLSVELEKKGIKLSEQQIKDLLVSVFNQFKDAFIEEWEEIIVEDEETGEEITYLVRRKVA